MRLTVKPNPMDKTAFWIPIFIFLATPLFAQEDPNWEEEGEIEEAEVVIEKDRQIELPRANRNFERVPPLPVSEPDIDITYQFVEVLPRLQQLTPPIRVLKVKEPPLPKLYPNYVKAGFGNYITPYLEVFANNARSEDYSYGIHFRHLSSRRGPVDGANSGNSDTRLGLQGKYFAMGHTLFGEASYQRERYHFYGYAPGTEVSRDDIRQVFNTIGVSGGIERNDVDAVFDYRLKLNYHHLNNAFLASENQFAVNFDADAQISDQLTFDLQSEIWYARLEDAPKETPDNLNTINRNLFRVKPYFTFRTSSEPQQGLEIAAGANLVYENDTLPNAERLHFYPFAQATYYLGNSLRAYARLDGDIERVSLLDLTNENPWLRPNVPVFHTNKSLSFGGGVAGRVNSLLGFNAGLSASNYKNMYFFANSATDSTEFNVLYDQGNVFVFNFYGELNINSQDRFRTTLRADYYAYDMDELEQPWHRPNLKMSVLSSYNLFDKLLLNAEFMLLSGLEGLNQATNRSVTLPMITDLSLKADYIFSPRFSTFLQFKNIFAQNYERYLNYPTRGFMLMGGLTYSF
jgi:hypothetical protein